MFDRKISRREMLRLGILTGAGVLLAACGGAPAAPQATQSPAATAVPEPTPTAAVAPTPTPEAATVAPQPAEREEVTLFYYDYDEASVKCMQSQIDRWNEQVTDKPRIKFDVVMTTGSEEVLEKAMNAMAAGTDIPDILGIEISLVSRFLKGDPPLCEQYLVDLKPALQAYNPNWESDYLGFASYTWQGKIYGIEWGLTPTGYYYRKDLFDEAGIEAPLETWEDWMQAGEKMKQAGHAMCAFDTSSLNEFIMEFYQAGGALFDEKGEVAIDEERAYKSLELVISAANSGIRWPTEAYWGAPHFAALNDGTVAGVISAIWYSPFVLKPNIKPEYAGTWRVQPMPAWKTSPPWGGPAFNTRRTSVWGGTGMTIPKQSAHPQLTFEWMAFSMLTKEGATSIWQISQQMPVVRSVIHDDSVTGATDEFFGGQVVNKVFADLADEMPPKYPHPFWNEAEQELNKVVAPAMAGEGTYESLIKDVADRIRQVMTTA